MTLSRKETLDRLIKNNDTLIESVQGPKPLMLKWFSKNKIYLFYGDVGVYKNHAILLIGEGGVGKSKIAHEVFGWCREDTPLFAFDKIRNNFLWYVERSQIKYLHNEEAEKLTETEIISRREEIKREYPPTPSRTIRFYPLGAIFDITRGRTNKIFKPRRSRTRLSKTLAYKYRKVPEYQQLLIDLVFDKMKPINNRGFHYLRFEMNHNIPEAIDYFKDALGTLRF